MRKGILIAAVAVLALGVFAGVWVWRMGGDAGPIALVRDMGSTGVATVGGPFQLIDHTGRAVTEADYRGDFLLVYFGYTYCPDVCPTSLLQMSQALDALGPLADRVRPIFITVDPERDTVEAMADYAPNFHENLVALTGTAEQVAAAAKAYRVYYAKAEAEGVEGYLMDHSGFIYLMDREGKYLANFSHNATAEDMSKALRGYVGS